MSLSAADNKSYNILRVWPVEEEPPQDGVPSAEDSEEVEQAGEDNQVINCLSAVSMADRGFVA